MELFITEKAINVKADEEITNFPLQLPLSRLLQNPTSAYLCESPKVMSLLAVCWHGKIQGRQ